jgi:hypothetical protein
VTRIGNVIRAGVDVADIEDVRIAVGTPGDFVAGRPSLTGDAEHDAISRAYASELEPIRDHAATLVLPEFNPAGYAEAARIGIELVPGVVLLRIGAGSNILGTDPSALSLPASTGPTGLDPLGLILLAPAALLALGLAGGGWAWWALGGAGGRAALLAAPSVGVGVAIAGTVAAERLGFLPASPTSSMIVLAFAGIGYLLAAPSSRQISG